ncbi:hypothetical protein Daesc_002274 [Daldinia eschscholtzii]|uniref:F-box domain-containing protein n=1 Tax=Daldinia eschscholtzii TaxID=292717 RepID=A0AAX6MWE6_9PEZI
MSEPGVNQPEESVVDRTATEATPGVKSPLNTLEHLPSELLNGILASLPDVKSLVSATSSCRAIYSTFKESESIIISSVLGKSLGLAFNEVAQHDVVWGEHSIELETTFDDAMIQDLLASGLERILQIASAKSYREREALLTVFEMPPGVNNVFLMYYFEGIEELNPEEDDALDILEAPAFFPDEDIGAEQIWRISLDYDPSRDFAIYDALDWTYRECGYVFWDQERLQALGALTPPWKPAERSPQNYSPIPLQEVYDSWRERSAIYKRGGRGYWSKGDYTRVVWPDRKTTSLDTDVRMPYLPESLAEAKEFWQAVLKLNIR